MNGMDGGDRFDLDRPLNDIMDKGANGRGLSGCGCGAVEWTGILLAVLFVVAFGGTVIAMMTLGAGGSAHDSYHEVEVEYTLETQRLGSGLCYILTFDADDDGWMRLTFGDPGNGWHCDMAYHKGDNRYMWEVD